MFYPWSYFPSWIDNEEAEYWNALISKQLEWNQPNVKVFSKVYITPRLTSFIGDMGISYSYSGTKHIATHWPDWFLPLLNNVKNKCMVDFNGCLVNLYRDGNDRMGWHSDDEKELDSSQPIASLSLGSDRDLFFKHRKNSHREAIALKNGDLLLMHPECQIEWLHSLPARRKVKQPRVNLTFRCYKNL